MMPQNIILSGTGGQGIVLAGIILAEAAIFENKQSIQTQSYGPEARGGASRSEVIISDEAIDYPKVVTADILLAMSQQAYDKYLYMLKKDGVLIVDSSNVKKIEKASNSILQIPITKTARDNLGKEMFANIVALGALAARTNIVCLDAITRSVLNRVPRETGDINVKALKLGYDLSS